ncbi:uncharacterized protein LOC129609226 [Condylostylus longicornis]|uniref:uncharacterized protein LOC129609226 n=1 Tax=Condylostylus longicornis TaxID=2530218 RepID=UPI00244DA855|nr:uncharacterized protein LOC129609226 [Condylostylus longicornis]
MDVNVNNDGKFLNPTYVTLENSDLISSSSSENANKTSDQAEIFSATNDPLADLLRKWNLFDDLYEVLKSKRVTLEVLMYMKERHVDEIFSGQNFDIKIIFEHKLGDWQNECGIYNLKPQSWPGASKNVNSPIHQWLANIGEKTPSSTCSHYSEANVSRTASRCLNVFQMNVLSILEKVEQSKSLLKKYEETQKLTPDDRTWIVHHIIQHVVENEKKITVNQCKDLAEQIINIFPTESVVTYFSQDNKKNPPKGKLWDRYQNRQRLLKKTVNQNRKRKLAEDFENINPSETSADFEELKRISAELKYIRDWEQVLKKWNQTILYRKKKLDENNMTLQEILKDWPLFKCSRAPELVNIDYMFSYPENNFNFSKWEKFCEVAEKIFSERVKDIKCKGFLKKTIEKKHSLSSDNLNICFMRLLHAILIPHTKVFQGSFIKYTIKDSQESFTMPVSQASDVDKIIAEKRTNCIKEKSTLQPFIVIVGKEFEYNMFYVCLDDIKFAFESYVETIQFCFKLMYTLNLKYPNESVSFWTFIQKFLFDIQTQTVAIPILLKNAWEMLFGFETERHQSDDYANNCCGME